MQTKTLAMLGAVLAALVLIAWLSGTFESDPSTLDVPDLAVESSAVESIEIITPGFAATVDHSGDRWTLAGSRHPADSVTVRTLLNAFEDLEATSVVSRSPERYVRYGVDSTATYVRLRTEAGDREFWIGSTAGDAGTGYIRMHGDERVFGATPRVFVPTDVDRWRDRRIFRASPQAVDRVAIDAPDGSFTINRTDGGWTIDRDGAREPADSASVVRYLGRFDPFRVDGFLERFDDAAPETHSLSLTLQSGSTWALSLREQDDAYAARVHGTDEPYKLLTSRLSTLFPDSETLTAGE